MTTTTLRHFQVARDYRTSVKPTREYVQRAARIWFNKRKLRQRTRQVMDFLSLPNQVTLKYKLR
jgi:hypothetical protein